MNEIIDYNKDNIIKNSLWVEDFLLQNLSNDGLEKELLKWAIVTPYVRIANKKNWVKLILKQNDFIGYSHKDGRLEIGVDEVPVNIKKQFWFNENVSDDFVKRYIFSHENGHHIMFYMFDNQSDFPKFSKLYYMCKKIRTTWKWLSELGSMSIYNWSNRDTAHEEDFVELLNKYCLNPKCLRSYLNFLVEWDKTILDQKGLFKISNKTADLLFDDISECVVTFLKKNNIVDRIK